MSDQERHQILSIVPDKAAKASELLKLVQSQSHLKGLLAPQALYNWLDSEEVAQPISYSNSNENPIVREKDGTMMPNVAVSDVQKKAMASILSSFAKKILTADMTGITLPIFMFEPETYLQKLAKGLSFAPEILKVAAQESDSLKQFQLVIKLFIANINRQLASKQPINPILGETYSCMIGDCYCSFEQTSHHPPISSFYLSGPGYTLTGSYEMKLSFSIPHAYMYVNGDSVLRFEQSGNVYKMNNPYVRIKGMLKGNKKFLVEGSGFVWSPTLNFFCPITFSPGGAGVSRLFSKARDRDEIEGTMYSVHQDIISKFQSTKVPRTEPKLAKNQFTSLGKVEGKWSSQGSVGNL